MKNFKSRASLNATSKAMEVETIQNNGASPKSQRSRKIFLSIFVLWTLICTQNCLGQITQIGTLPYGNAPGPIFDENINMFYYNSEDYSATTGWKTLKLYYPNGTIYKTSTIPYPPDKSSGSKIDYADRLLLFSRYVFNNDDKIEFLAVRQSGIYVCNEDGQVVYDFGTYTPYVGTTGIGGTTLWNPHVFKTSDNKYYLSIRRGSVVEVYSLPGIGQGEAPTNIENVSFSIIEKVSPFPNPANTVITLPYKLKEGEVTSMYIYNVSGQLIDSMQIDYLIESVLLDVSNYQKGTYIYKVNDVSSKFIVE